ncbi:ubiquinone biosynthesis monooxygenase UbiB [Caloranaerobacter azorensis H53214]|uniref:Ubiquinone biosynthesis monooxygenase UbiB n=1 Tax=Caloranaerobacter azorensis H53214 TaxID=1156417 RepID=A0A096BL88_9FIRM|nr:AarF/UbiB family protein [Caloranaerobacter azorensis]KGG81513.1 ubiquinone biosynthesis monooxygenase UbiB [Caloranaerobacter azorensis H53214]
MKLFLYKRRKKLKRYREIAKILTKYGFDMIAERIDNRSIISKIFIRSKKYSQKYTKGERIRFTLEELGPTFIKFGQILSTRYDILPKDIVDELSKLQDEITPFDLDTAKNIIRDELGKDLEDVFIEFQEEPLAAASIGQVYRGVLKDGNKVVIKVQRPNIDETIKQDIDILYTLAKLFDDILKKKMVISARDIVEEFSYFIRKELDYTYEAQNCERFRMYFKNDERVVIPKIYWEYTTKKVLVMEEIKGIKVSDIDEIDKMGFNKEKLSELGAKVFLEQIFIHGFFHGDPHPGNILVLSENKISFIDFGVVGYLDNLTFEFITTLLRAAIDRDIDKIVESLYKMNAISAETDEIGLKKELFFIINYYFDLPINKINFGEAFNEIMSIAYKYKLKMPSQLTLLIKSIITIEGTGKKLNPHFNLSKISKEIIKKITKRKFNPKSVTKKIIDTTTENIENIFEITNRVNDILYKIDKDKLKIKMEIEGLNKLEKEIYIMTNKLALSLIISSIIVGSSIIIQAHTGPEILGMSAFGLIGFLAAGILGVSLIVSILLNKRNYK